MERGGGRVKKGKGMAVVGGRWIGMSCEENGEVGGGGGLGW